MVMHKEFADWYRAASVAVPQDLLNQRWSGVEQATATLNGPRLIDLVDLFATAPHPGYQTPPFLDDAFRAHDAAFPTRDNFEELRVLAGAILRHSIENNSNAATAAAYGLSTAAFYSSRVGPPVKEHVAAAEIYLANRAVSVRSSDLTAAFPVPLSKDRFGQLLQPQVFQQNQTPNLRDPLLGALAEQSTNTSEHVEQRCAELSNLIKVQREELNLLWWLQNAFSKDLQRPFAQLSKNLAACVLPSELADLTLFIPEPPAILGMIISSLSKASGDDESSIEKAVNAAPREWRTARVQPTTPAYIPCACPVSLAIQKSLETDGPQEWLPAYKKLCRVSADSPLPARDIAHQVYRERMFLRAVSEMLT